MQQMPLGRLWSLERRVLTAPLKHSHMRVWEFCSYKRKDLMKNKSVFCINIRLGEWSPRSVNFHISAHITLFHSAEKLITVSVLLTQTSSNHSTNTDAAFLAPESIERLQRFSHILRSKRREQLPPPEWMLTFPSPFSPSVETCEDFY